MPDKEQTIKKGSIISTIGLDEQEIAVIKTVCDSEIRLNEKFILKDLESEGFVDMVFINGDSHNAIDTWELIAKTHSETLPIMLCTETNKRNDFFTLQKPLKFKILIQTLDSLTSTPVSNETEDNDINLDSARILVVDDSFPARQFMKFKLEEIIPQSLNIKVEFADSGETALELIKQSTFDLVFLDVTMPGKDGYEVCILIKQISLVQVAMLTGLNDAVDKIKGDVAGCDYYLTKPPQDEELLNVIKSTFDWRSLKN